MKFPTSSGTGLWRSQGGAGGGEPKKEHIPGEERRPQQRAITLNVERWRKERGADIRETLEAEPCMRLKNRPASGRQRGRLSGGDASTDKAAKTNEIGGDLHSETHAGPKGNRRTQNTTFAFLEGVITSRTSTASELN